MRPSIQNICPKEHSKMAIVLNLLVTINLYEECLPVITWPKKHSSEQVEGL